MAKQPRSAKPVTKPEESFANLMLVAAAFSSSRGGIEAAEQALHDAGHFIEQAGSVHQAFQALEVLERLKSKIDNPTNPPAAVATPNGPPPVA